MADPVRARASGEPAFLAWTALGLVLFPFALHLIGGYAGLATQILIMGIGAIGFNVLLGYAGLLSYGQAAFYGLGGYMAALTLMRFFPQVHSIELAVIVGILSATAFALVSGALVVRLYGIYFALLTVAFAEMVYFVIFQWRDLTGGDDGLQGIPAPPLFGTIDLATTLPPADLGPFGNLSDIKYWYIAAAIVVLAVLWFVRRLVASQFGEVLTAIRENEERSTLVGYRPAAYKLAAFGIAGALAGLSGALRALYDGSTSPDALTIDTSGNFVIFTVIGGVRTLFGPLVGTGLTMYLQNVISARTDAWRLIEGIIFVAVIVFLPGGLLGSFRKNGVNVLGRALATPKRAKAVRP